MRSSAAGCNRWLWRSHYPPARAAAVPSATDATDRLRPGLAAAGLADAALVPIPAPDAPPHRVHQTAASLLRRSGFGDSQTIRGIYVGHAPCSRLRSHLA